MSVIHCQILFRNSLPSSDILFGCCPVSSSGALLLAVVSQDGDVVKGQRTGQTGQTNVHTDDFAHVVLTQCFLGFFSAWINTTYSLFWMQTLSRLSRGANAEGFVNKQKQALEMIMAVITQPATQTSLPGLPRKVQSVGFQGLYWQKRNLINSFVFINL